MRPTLLIGGAIALSLLGATGVRAETIMVEQAYDTAPAYVADVAPPYAAEPAPYAAPYAPYPGVAAPVVARPYVYEAPVDTTVVVAEPGYATEPAPVIVQRPRRVLIERAPAWVAPPRVYEARRPMPLHSRRIEAAYAEPGSCTIDVNGFERCY